MKKLVENRFFVPEIVKLRTNFNIFRAKSLLIELYDYRDNRMKIDKKDFVDRHIESLEDVIQDYFKS